MLSSMAILLPNQQVVVYTALSLAFVRVGNDHASGVFCGSYLFKLNLIVKLKGPEDWLWSANDDMLVSSIFIIIIIIIIIVGLVAHASLASFIAAMAATSST